MEWAGDMDEKYIDFIILEAEDICLLKKKTNEPSVPFPHYLVSISSAPFWNQILWKHLAVHLTFEQRGNFYWNLEILSIML